MGVIRIEDIKRSNLTQQSVKTRHLVFYYVMIGCRNMNEKIRTLLQSTRGETIGLFIDNANWFYPQKELGWRISFSRLREFLQRYYKISVANVYAGTPIDEKDEESFGGFKSAVERAGYSTITKPLKKIWLDRAKEGFVYKCNFDVEIAFDISRNIGRLDIIMIGSGDSDFLEAKNFAIERNKKFIVLCFERGVAWEMRKLYHIFLEELKREIQQ